MSPAQEKNTRLKILQETKSFLSEGNIDPSMSEIAKKCGVTKSALYYFFKNKRELIFAIMQTSPIELLNGIEEVCEKKMSADKKLKGMMTFATKFFQKEKSISRDIFRQIFAQDEEFLKILYTERKKVVVVFQKVIEEGIASGVFRKVDSEKTAEIICGFIDFLGICFTLPCPSGEKKCGKNPLELCDQLVDLIKSE